MPVRGGFRCLPSVAVKQPRYHISLLIIVPAIFAGLVILTAITTYHVFRYSYPQEQSPRWLILVTGCLAAGAFVCGIVVVRFLIKPLERFAARAASLPILHGAGVEVPSGTEINIDAYSRFFHQLTDVLSKVEARRSFPEIIGESRAIRAVFGRILKVAPTDATVLLTGESGTGKELVASALHRHSRRREKPFVTLNCAAIPEGLLESELFGHEKGAFTGAVNSRQGKFELADGGTLFLDEIGDMPLETQAKILRVLQEKEFERVGGSRTVKVNVRFIAATNKDLFRLVRRGSFRDDLFYRLNVFALKLPPLRERMEDLPLLVNGFLERSPAAAGKSFSPAALQVLLGYDWPGNIRELENAVARAAVLSDGRTIEPVHLQLPQMEDSEPAARPDDRERNAGETLDEQLRRLERTRIVQALTRTKGIQVRAAELLGISQRSLWHRVKKHDIDVAALKSTKNDEK